MAGHSFVQFVFGIVATSSLIFAAPCDIYNSGNVSCVAAHSTTRALFNNYNSALYQIQRQSDSQTKQISVRQAGGVANGDDHDAFCANTTCILTTIYDQSGRNNHLTVAPSGGATGGPGAGPLNGGDYPASSCGAPVTLNGQKAYGLFISPMTGYRNNQAVGLATGDNPQGMYMVADGTHFNHKCCFDYGNAETSSNDTGNAHMEAIYFGQGDEIGSGNGSGSGPWVLGDLENGLWPGDTRHNYQNPSQTSRFVTAIVKGDSGNRWAIRGGNANSGDITTYFDGPRPNGYKPMYKEGAIILGIGGDNSYWGQGTFYEGVITSGYPSDDQENDVQADIVSQHYQSASLVSGPTIHIGSTISIQATTSGNTDEYLSHSGTNVLLQVANNGTDQAAATWIVRQGLGFSECISLESRDTPGSYLRHYNSRLFISPGDGSQLFHQDATFCPRAALNSAGTHSFRSWNYPIRNIRHYGNDGYIAYNGQGTANAFDNPDKYNDDVSFIVRQTSADGIIGNKFRA